MLSHACMQGSDAISTSTVAVAIIKLCYDLKEWTILNEQIVSLCKRRAQMKKVQFAVVDVLWMSSYSFVKFAACAQHHYVTCAHMHSLYTLCTKHDSFHVTLPWTVCLV